MPDVVRLTIDAWCLEQAAEDMAALRAMAEAAKSPFPLPFPVEVM